MLVFCCSIAKYNPLNSELNTCHITLLCSFIIVQRVTADVRYIMHSEIMGQTNIWTGIIPLFHWDMPKSIFTQSGDSRTQNALYR